MDLHLRVRNVTDRGVTFLFDTLHPSEVFNATKRRFERADDHNLQSRYFWLGCTRIRTEQLQAQEVVEIPLKAAFYNPGDFNLDRFQFTVEVEGQTPKLYPVLHQHLVKVISV